MLERLKAYKEFIAILLFFAGGFAWMERTYLSRDSLSGVERQLAGLDARLAEHARIEDVQTLSCLLNAYMLLTQRQMRAMDVERMIAENTRALTAPFEAVAEAARSPAMMIEFERKQDELGALRAERRALRQAMADTTDRLERHECGRLGA
ncbi:hypothetical protein [Rubrimonas cliftonensis]|uniref:Uncharacterized protein n=1 Tax=Rubrimonas cliftonensis TaxID=89524 RepID=A0A1H4CGZ3_9RHOB|nr:hypothetical protein [Rubrimonas cliftonensis]SEA59322.1 hypothetical protein SAMN05444370_10758 [Rubrimonas cliftonensis]